jgi:hypothetical protein
LSGESDSVVVLSRDSEDTLDRLNRRLVRLESALLDALLPLTMVAKHPSAIGRMPVVQESAARVLTLIHEVLGEEGK